MRLNFELLESIRSRVDAELDAHAQKDGLQSAIQEGLYRVTHGDPLDAENNIVERFWLIIWLFRHCRSQASMPRKTFDELSKMAEFSLRLMGIKPYNSQLSYLFGILYRTRAVVLGDNDDAWLAAWSLQLADAMVGNGSLTKDVSQEFEAQLRLAEYKYSAGFVCESLEAYRKTDELASKDDEIARARLGIIRALRIFNETTTALTMASSVKALFDVPPELLDKVNWEIHLITAQRDGDVSGLIRAIVSIKMRRLDTDPYYFILACLWCYASRQRGVIADLPRSSWIKRRIVAPTQDQGLNECLGFLALLEDCYTTGPDASRTDIFVKLKVVGDFLANLRKGEPREHSVIFLAAITRWLVRVKQRDGAALVQSEYQRCSHQFSHGRSGALFGLLDDLGEGLNASKDLTRTSGEAKTLKTGMDRTILYLEMFAKLSLAAVEFKTGQLFGSKSQDANERDLIIKVSRYFVDYAAGAMKGPVHKLTQLMLNITILPDEAAENFKSVLWSKHIVPEKAMRRVLEGELGRKTEDIFAEFDFSPIGVGSVSQVYRARLKSGEEVAVKIQFPDLEKIIEQDLAIFSRIFTSVSWLFPKHDVTAINDQLRQMISRELDFREEAEIQEKFRLISEKGARWCVPKVHLELSSRRVMTSELIRGANFYQFAEQASVEERQEAAKAISDFALRSITEAGLVCVDPHPANLIFRGGKVYVIDFGFFMPATPSFVQMVQRMILAYHPMDDEYLQRFLNILQDSKLLITPPDISDAEAREFVEILLRQFNWRSSGDPNLQGRFNDLFFKKGFNKVFGSHDPTFFLGYIGYIQCMRSISKLNAPQPDSWYTELCDELAVHIQGSGCSSASHRSGPGPSWGSSHDPAKPHSSDSGSNSGGSSVGRSLA